MATTVEAVPRAVDAPVSEKPVVQAEHLSKRFGELVAVDDLSFALERGTVTGFLGPNGAGKTTTLRMLLHLVQPTAGRALVFGRRYQDLERPARRVGAVLEAADFHPGRSGRDHLFSLALALGRETDGGQLVPRARASGGQARRCGARAGRARRGRPPPRRQLLARDAAAARPRRRAARRPRAADPRRAGERARPGGRPLAARLHARLRGRGKDRPRLQPRAGRGRTDGRPGDDHQQGQARHLRAARPADREAHRHRPRPCARRAPAAGGAGGRGHPLDAAGRRRAARRGRAERARRRARLRRRASRCTSWCRSRRASRTSSSS